jgi:NADH-quinone oxidoreductase subunit F
MEEENKEKYIVCNGDEGEPGTFKDRMLLEENSFLLICGIITNSHKSLYIHKRRV